MIKNIEIRGVHTTVTPELQKYVDNKIGKLDRFTPRHARESVRADVFLKESKNKTKKTCTCEVIMHLPQERIATKESTVNMFAAIDIVEAKLKNRLKKYKDTHGSQKLHRKVLARLRRQTGGQEI
ncbi:MAG: ribosome-associated translation inhibitor RaiA [Candidatus Saccharibacteria bacterium]|nr:ribosome-associated translation inhibitor RaiA [Candidatus Saccharibacteria bacterium]